MTQSQSIYAGHLDNLTKIQDKLVRDIDSMRDRYREINGEDPIEHVLSRIKSEESMREKCVRKGLPVTGESAVREIKDAIGVRIVCTFIDDIYLIKEEIAKLPGIYIDREKDYVRHAKPNGYRSYHLILRITPQYYEGDETEGTLDSVDGIYYAEIQLRTISMDTWAALEHQLKYKKDISGNTVLITSELKRCADELAATDASMQTIHDMINSNE